LLPLFIGLCSRRPPGASPFGGGTGSKIRVRGPRAFDMAQRLRKSEGLIPNFLRNAVLKCDELLKPS